MKIYIKCALLGMLGGKFFAEGDIAIGVIFSIGAVLLMIIEICEED